MRLKWAGLLAALMGGSAVAGEVEVLQTEFIKKGKGWTVRTQLKHDDTGWDHYADAWRIVDEAGQVIAERILHHPHENEQPFTRGLGNVMIPSGTRIVYIEARDNVHGWAKGRIRVDITQSSGQGYQVRRH